MHLKSFQIRNFRRLVDVTVELDLQTTVFVGANNSGKTSAAQAFHLFLGEQRGQFTLFDFSAECWKVFDAEQPNLEDELLPAIELDLWFDIDDNNIHRAVDFLPDLDWNGEPIGVRISYEAKDPAVLYHNFREAVAKASTLTTENDSKYTPWPHNMTDFLKKRLNNEFELRYYSLRNVEGDDLNELTVEPHPLGNLSSGTGKQIDALIRVDFLDAQRSLTDDDSRGRFESLSKRLSRYYSRNLTKQDADLDALSAIADSEERLNAHFADAFAPVMASLKELGYPGAGNYSLAVKAEFNVNSILTTNANVHYVLPGRNASDTAGVSLPDRYNGLGFKNLIFMAVEILDFHHSWEATEGDRPPIHLILIEEPESHLHAQLQQIFVRQIMKLVPSRSDDFRTQIAITTHSAHIIYENEFRAIRYFKREKGPDGVHRSDVRDLSKFYDDEDHVIREFLRKYLKLTHCDLFFADGAILVEGNVERLLVPLMVRQGFPGLNACHLTVLEVGGAFAHKFDNLIDFLDIPTLVITDLDSVKPKPEKSAIQGDLFDASDADEHEALSDDSAGVRTKCMTTFPGAETSNVTLSRLAPKLTLVSDLLNAKPEQKFAQDVEGKPRALRVAYQTEIVAHWRGERFRAAARTLEEAFALENLEWCQNAYRKHLGLTVRGNASMPFSELHQKIHNKIENLDKTNFALALITEEAGEWITPHYIRDGLDWLQNILAPEHEQHADSFEITLGALK